MHYIDSIVTSNNLQDLSYSYDKFGNLASRKDNKRNLEETFTYDEQNRLTGIIMNGMTASMTYDAFGRMSGKQAIVKKNGTPQVATVFSSPVFDNTKVHALTEAEMPDYLVSPNTQKITYSSFDKVKTIDEGDSHLVYQYGYDQQRIAMTETVGSATRKKQYAGNCEFVNEDGVEKSWTFLSGPYGVFAVVEKKDAEENIHYILKDHLGSWTTITDAEGIVEQELSYDAWGNLRDPETWYNHTQADPVEAPMFDRGYTGHEHMTAFGLINMNGRCYDPLMSSFLSVDEYVQDPTSAQNFNRYAYCLNNPLKYTDPSGWYYVGGGHSSTSLQGPYECTWTLPERRTIDPSLVMDFLDYWTSFWEGEEFKNGGSGGGVVIKGKDGINTAYSPGMTYKGNDQFTKNAINSLNEIYSQGGDFGKQMISTLVQSKYTYYITDLAEGGSKFKEEDTRCAYFDQKLEELDPSQTSEWLNKVKIGCGGTIYWNRGQLYRSGEEMILNSTLVLSHELVHAWDACWGVLQDGPTDLSDLNYREWSACYWSNRIAQDMSIPIMTHYAGDDASYYSETKTFTGIWYEVVDSYNNPIYKDRY